MTNLWFSTAHFPSARDARSRSCPANCYYVRMAFRALISDLDGTLLDTLQDLADSVNASLIRLGLPPHDIAAYRFFVGDGRRMMALRALPEDRRDEPTLTSLLQYIGEDYTRRYMDHSQPFEGIPALLDALTARGVRMSVLSNKPQHYVSPMVSRLLSQWSFEFVLGESADVARKPDPAGALRIVAQMSVGPDECLYMGDSGVDMETATAAGLYPVGVLWGYRTAAELTSGGARLLVEHPTDLLRVLDA
jgi:phosphoglycolate phosphatase